MKLKIRRVLKIFFVVIVSSSFFVECVESIYLDSAELVKAHKKKSILMK